MTGAAPNRLDGRGDDAVQDVREMDRDAPADQRTLRVAAYCRVSTDREDQRSSLEAQRAFFEEYIAARRDWIPAGVFADEGLSGTSASRRPAFTGMLDQAMAGEIDLILTKEISRFARNTVDALTVTRQLKTLGVGVIFLNDGIDTRESDGEFRLTIMAGVAQEESRKISERTRWGQARAMKRGVVFGSDSLYGYHLRGGRLTPDPEQAAVVRRIYQTYLEEGKGAWTIARELTQAGIDPPMGQGRPWSSATVLRILRNVKYTGDLVQQQYRTLDHLSHRKVRNDGTLPMPLFRDHHEAIVSREAFARVREELARRRGLSDGGRRFTARYWYSGKVICGGCGSSFTVRRTRRGGKEYARFLCRGRTSARRGEPCGMRGVSLRMAETCARHVLDRLPLDRDAMLEALLSELGSPGRTGGGTDREAGAVRQAVRRLTARRERALEAFLDGTITRDDWMRLSGKYGEELDRLSGLPAAPAAPPELSRDRLDALRALLREELDGGPKVLEEVIERIVVFADRFEVSVRDLPVRFVVRARGLGSGRSYRVEVTDCTVTPDRDPEF